MHTQLLYNDDPINSKKRSLIASFDVPLYNTWGEGSRRMVGDGMPHKAALRIRVLVESLGSPHKYQTVYDNQCNENVPVPNKRRVSDPYSFDTDPDPAF
jgi:hypothetical protein